MKHIAFLITSLTAGGAERVTVSVSRFLLEHGYAVTIITTGRADTDFYDLPEGVKRVSLNLAGQNKGLFKLTANLYRVKKIRAVLKNIKPDVLVGMMTTSAIFAVLASIGVGVNTLISERNYPDSKPIGFIWKVLRRILYGFSDGHIAQTYKSLEWLQINTHAKNIHVIPNSVQWPMLSFEPAILPVQYVSSDKNIILAVGTKLHQKGFDLLLESFKSVSSQNPNWVLVIAGIDKDKSLSDWRLVISLIKKFKLEDKVIVIGRVGNIGDWYERADIFALSSRYEGFPNVLLEAMACGCACVAFDCDTGPRDILTDGIDGLLVEPENTVAYANKLKKLMVDKELRIKTSNSAINVRDKYSESNVLSLWKDVIDSL